MGNVSAADNIAFQKKTASEEIRSALFSSANNTREMLYARAYTVKEASIGKTVYYRGLIEFSNICEKNCYYCGIRSANTNANRYIMSIDEILQCAQFAFKAGYGSLVMQSGERSNSDFINFVIEAVKRIKNKTDGKLGITLCVGEQTHETYKRFFDAGAHRYLLRIETSDEDLYKTLHPDNPKHSHQKRLACLSMLKDIGYQVGTGVMIGLPGQTLEHNAKDIEFFMKIDIDMVGMGPYIEHENTPLVDNREIRLSKIERFERARMMIATLRLAMPDINIAATTALQTLDPLGREKGILAGANVVMPNLTPLAYRGDYNLYDNKPCVNDTPDECAHCLERRITSIGERVGYNEWGDSKHFMNRQKKRGNT